MPTTWRPQGADTGHPRGLPSWMTVDDLGHLTLHPAERVLPPAEGADAVRGVEGAVGLHQVLRLQPCHSLQGVYVLGGDTEGKGSGVRQPGKKAEQGPAKRNKGERGRREGGRSKGAGCAYKPLCSLSGGADQVGKSQMVKGGAQSHTSVSPGPLPLSAQMECFCIVGPLCFHFSENLFLLGPHDIRATCQKF